MSASEVVHDEEIHPFSRLIAEELTEWIEGCLNDHIVYPKGGLDDDAYMAQRKYALDEVEFEETDVAVHAKGKNKLDGLPERLAGVLKCHDSRSGKRIGTVTVKLQFDYDLDASVTRPTT